MGNEIRPRKSYGVVLRPQLSYKKIRNANVSIWPLPPHDREDIEETEEIHERPATTQLLA